MLAKPPDFQPYWEEVLEEAGRFQPSLEILPWELEDPNCEGEYVIDGRLPERLDQSGANPFDFRWDSHALLTGLTVRKVLFRSADGVRVGGILQYPRGSDRKFPCIVHFTGYGGELLVDSDFVSSGYAVLGFSHRGMLLGSEGFDRYAPLPLLVRGVEDRQSYVYRAIVLDCLLALKVARGLDPVDPRRIAVMGTSQGGGLSILIGALQPEVKCLSADLPWLTDFAYQLSHEGEGPYRELREYLRRYPQREQAAMATLGYFDTLHFAGQLTQPALVSLGTGDRTSPPQSVRNLFERIPSTKLLLELRDLGHERSTIWRYLTGRWFDFYL